MGGGAGAPPPGEGVQREEEKTHAASTHVGFTSTKYKQHIDIRHIDIYLKMIRIYQCLYVSC